MTLTEEDARKVLGTTLELIRLSGARELLEGIDESRRLGVEETLPEQKRSELKQVARTRRRPPSDIEMVHIALEQLYQRLIVLPKVAAAIKERLDAQDIIWRVDTEFASATRFPEAKLSDFSPDGMEEISANFDKIMRLLPAVREEILIHGQPARTE